MYRSCHDTLWPRIFRGWMTCCAAVFMKVSPDRRENISWFVISIFFTFCHSFSIHAGSSFACFGWSTVRFLLKYQIGQDVSVFRTPYMRCHEMTCFSSVGTSMCRVDALLQAPSGGLVAPITSIYIYIHKHNVHIEEFPYFIGMHLLTRCIYWLAGIHTGNCMDMHGYMWVFTGTCGQT